MEQKRLRQHFGHPSTDKLYKLLRCANADAVNEDTLRAQQKIEKRRHSCPVYAQRPRLFKFTFRDRNEFNHTFYAAIFILRKRPFSMWSVRLLITKVQDGLPNIYKSSMALRLCWIDFYLGPPDIIAHNAGRKYMAVSFSSNADSLYICTKAIPVESVNSMKIVELYHQPIRRTFSIICMNSPHTDLYAALQMAVEAVNNSVGPEGLVPTVLVYGGLSRWGLPHDPRSPSTVARVKSLCKSTSKMSKTNDNRQVRDALRARNGPDVSYIRTTPLGSHFLVYRPKTDRWEVLYDFVDVNGEYITVLLPHHQTQRDFFKYFQMLSFSTPYLRISFPTWFFFRRRVNRSQSGKYQSCTWPYRSFLFNEL